MTTKAPNEATVELAIEGMTCATRAMRVEKKLGGVRAAASVNLATERATVRSAPRVVELERSPRLLELLRGERSDIRVIPCLSVGVEELRTVSRSSTPGRRETCKSPP